MKESLFTREAPDAIGTYSQATAHQGIVYLSGQIALDPSTMQLVSTDFKTQTQQVFKNMRAVCKAAGGGLDDIVKLTIYILDFSQFAIVNDVMSEFFKPPYPARTTIAVVGLPKNALIEVDAMMAVN